MNSTLENAVGQLLMLSFVGTEPSAEVLEALRRDRAAGVTLFRHLNVRSPGQVRALTAALQAAAADCGLPPLLIAADQEGGTLLALPGATPFPGNLALGAAGSPDLARRTGYAIGRELAAMGININYAPVCDVNSNPHNVSVGPRSFGEDPVRVAELGAAMIEGMQTAGVAATAKHFPGLGDAGADSHHELPQLLHTVTHLQTIELPPFAAAIRAGVRLVMTAHIALPVVTEGLLLPATLSPAILRGLLRNEMGFAGVIITDALEMKAIQQGPGLLIDAIAAVAAGNDLLLLNVTMSNEGVIYQGLLQAARRTLLPGGQVRASAERVLALKEWTTRRAPPALEVVGCVEHQALAFEIAAQAVTLVRNAAGCLPIQLPSDAPVAVVVPQPQDLTPADTSSYERPALAQAVRAQHGLVDEFVMPIDPAESDVSALRAQLARYALVIVGTIGAALHPGQAALINALLAEGVATIVVALRMPYDLVMFPAAPTFVCAYSLQPASLQALAQALWGRLPFRGRLPVSIPGLYAVGHGLDLDLGAR